MNVRRLAQAAAAVAAIGVGSAVVVAAVCWLTGSFTPQAIGLGLMIVGAGQLGLGVFSYLGTMRLVDDWSVRYQHAPTRVRLPAQSPRQTAHDQTTSLGFMALMGAAGLLTIVVGFLVRGLT